MVGSIANAFDEEPDGCTARLPVTLPATCGEGSSTAPRALRRRASELDPAGGRGKHAMTGTTRPTAPDGTFPPVVERVVAW